MAVLKKHLSSIGRKGSIVKHAGKGSKIQPLNPAGNAVSPDSNPFSQTINDYAKSTPMANPSPSNILGGVSDE